MADSSGVTDNGTTATTTVLPSAFTASSNGIACDAIAAKLTEVTKIAESLDSILRELQDGLDEARADVGDGSGKPPGGDSIDVSDIIIILFTRMYAN